MWKNNEKGHLSDPTPGQEEGPGIPWRLRTQKKAQLVNWEMLLIY